MTDTSAVLIRPRLTDYYGVSQPQSKLNFAIPFFAEDSPLYVDPFLLWKSPSQQDQALHTSVINSFNHLNHLLKRGKSTEARDILVLASECEEIGLGHSRTKKGIRIGPSKAAEILALFNDIPEYSKNGFRHFEEIQLYVADISKDRVSDLCCSFIKSFLIDYTLQECQELGIPVEQTTVKSLYSYRDNRFLLNQQLVLPVNPITKAPIILVPKRWLRFNPWISYDEYFKDYCPRDEIFKPGEPEDHVKVLTYNRDHYGVVQSYVATKIRTQADCHNDPLFAQIPVLSAKRRLQSLQQLPTGKENNADRHYEDHLVTLLASLLYPDLDFAAEQSRTVSGTLIRDLIFYNNRSIDFLQEIYQDYDSRQLVFELKNVAKVDGGHINQLNRYLETGFGRFGVVVTRNRLPQAMFRNTIDLWSGQRRCVIALADEDLNLMVNLFESRQRPPIDVVKKKYLEFRRACPS